LQEECDRLIISCDSAESELLEKDQKLESLDEELRDAQQDAYDLNRLLNQLTAE
jgi:hypothetical protein